jgi:hypothetical protein
MLRTFTATMAAYLLAAISSVLAQTTPQGGAAGPGAAGGVGAGGTTGSEGSLADWWWVILLVILIGVAIWYFTSRRTRV